MTTPTTATAQLVTRWTSPWWTDPTKAAAIAERQVFVDSMISAGKRADGYQVQDDSMPNVITVVHNYLDTAAAQEAKTFADNLVTKYSLPIAEPMFIRPMGANEPPHYIGAAVV